jgi:hypothetical protein
MKAHEVNELQSLAALEALGLLDDTEKRTFSSLLLEHEEARAALIGFERTASVLATMAPAKQPPSALHERLIGQIPGRSARKAELNIAPGLLLVFAAH